MKLKGFSFLEILVSILISGIVISTAYSAYVFAHKQLFKLLDIKTATRNYFELSTILNSEFETAKKVIKKQERKITFQFADKTIDYSFNDQFILRQIGEHRDTFFFPVSFVEINAIDETKALPIVDYLKLIIEEKGENKNMCFFKDYGAIVKIEE